jgi:HAAS domain-containing protein
VTIDAYLAELERALPRARRDRALREVREHLRDAAARHRAGGASDFDAETAATRDFGPVDEVARRLSAELAVRKKRMASALVLLLSVALVAALSFAAGVSLDVGEDEAAPTPVLIANRVIEAGTPGMIVASDQMYTATTIPKGEVLDDAIADPTFLTGRAVAVQILPGKQLTETDFHP